MDLTIFEWVCFFFKITKKKTFQLKMVFLDRVLFRSATPQSIVHLYVHMDDDFIHDIKLIALREVQWGGKFVTYDAGVAQEIVNLFNSNNVVRLRLVSKYLIFTIEEPEAKRLKLTFGNPITLTANYGTKVTIILSGPDAKQVNGLEFHVTPP